jgi:hypothetical protein
MPGIAFQSARTAAAEPAAAAEDLVGKLEGGTPKLVTLFASHGRDHAALNRELRQRLPKGTRLIGASTGGEIDQEGLHRGTAVLGAFSGDFEVGLGLGKKLGDDAIAAGAEAMRAACRDLGTSPADLDRTRHIGLVIDDGFRMKKEELLLGAQSDNPDVVLVGGGASSDQFEPDQVGTVHVDGEVTGDAVLVAVFASRAPFAAMRSHWYHPTGRKLTITKVDESCMRALEIDGKPAAARYAELLGVGVDDLEFGKPGGIATAPTATRMGREYMIRAAYKPLPDGSLLFANLLEDGMELEIMRMGDPAEMTRRFFTEEIPARVPDPKAALFFHCGARVWYAMMNGKLEALSATLRDAPPCAGFNVTFEIYNGLHVNTTLTALVFG